MADLAVVALGLDATAMTSGAAQANRALTSVEKEMSQAEKQSTQFSKALTSLGGPFGQVGGQIDGLTGRFGGLVESFGLAGGAAIALGAAVVALAAGMARLTIEGAKIADEMGDISEATGLSLDQVQQLSVAMGRAGESTQSVERNFKTFEAAVVEAQDSSSKAAQNFRTLGIDASKAGDDVGAAFIEALSHLQDYQKTSEQAVASTEVFGRGISSLVRSAGDLNDILSKSRQELEDTGLIASKFALEHAANLDKAMNRLNTDFRTFQTILSGIDGGVVTGIFDDIAAALEKINGWLNAIGPKLDLFFSLPFVSSIAGGAFGNNVGAGTGIATGGAAGGGRGAGGLGGGGGGVRGSAVARGVDPAIAAQERENAAARKKTADDFIKDLEDLEEAVRGTVVTFLTFKQLDVKGLLAGLPAPTLPGIDFGPIKDTTFEQGLPRTFFSDEDKQRLDAEFSGIFDDFVTSIIAGRATFAGFLQGMLDIFAQEFARSFREAFITPLVKSMTDLLSNAIDEIFGSISGKGLGKFFKAIGTAFVGAFAEGGTIPSGHWGLVGEKGPEIAFAGGSPMHIQPIGAGGNITMNFAISTASGEVSQRTQDQIADSAARGIERASRLRGAR